jgi:hypothetical protein
MIEARSTQASLLMDDFARRTGVTGHSPPRRYLWTDAHAVCNWLALERELADPRYLDLAVKLVAQVHDVLGRHRADDARSGWISGMSESQGAQHPTGGGLRIGKPRPERRATDPSDEQAEWDQDGQYYHYLTRWQHALYKMAVRTDQTDYLRWAVELALAAHQGFRARSDPPRLYWKMSIDLSYPLVASSGHHDPLDGLISSLVLRASRNDPDLDRVVADLGELCRGRSWLTDDPLGIGGLLFDACRLAQLQQTSADPLLAGLLAEILDAAVTGLSHFVSSDTLRLSPDYRLAFRELGLAIGLWGLPVIQESRPDRHTQRALAAIRPYQAVGELIEEFWLQPQNQSGPTWIDHQDINSVMLATSLTRNDFLRI